MVVVITIGSSCLSAECASVNTPRVLDAASYDWERVVTLTKPEKTDTSGMNFYFDAPIDWGEVKHFAETGDPSSQYCYGQRCLTEAEKLTNGARFSRRFEGYMFLLVAAICGEFTDSMESFAFVGDITDLNKKTPISEFIKKAAGFARNI